MTSQIDEQLDDEHFDSDSLDEEFLVADGRGGPGRLTLALAAGIVLVAVFAGGVLAQKHWGSGDSGATAFPGGAAGAPGGRGDAAGGFPGGGSFPGGSAGSGSSGSGAPAGSGSTSSSGSSGSASTSTAPAVIGTVVKVSGNKVTVKNFAGKTVTVTVPDGATVTAKADLDDLSKGDSVTVTGTTDSDGDVTATAVTSR